MSHITGRIWCSNCKVTKPIFQITDKTCCEYCKSNLVVISVENTFEDRRSQKKTETLNYSMLNKTLKLLYDSAKKCSSKEEFIQYCKEMNTKLLKEKRDKAKRIKEKNKNT